MRLAFQLYPIVPGEPVLVSHAKLFELLDGIRETGSLNQAAQTQGLSYRHAWGLLRLWEAYLGAPLVNLVKGRGATLTDLGERVSRGVARVHDELEQVFSKLNQTFIDEVFPSDRATLRIRILGSHDRALEQMAAGWRSTEEVDVAFCSSIEALAALTHGDCEAAGFYVSPLQGRGSYGHLQLRKWLKPARLRLLRVLTREQGVMLAPGWSGPVREFSELVRAGARFVNRQRSSGMRQLLDEILLQHGLEPRQLRGYGEVVYTQDSMIQALRQGAADAGLGSRADAQSAGLGFLPLTSETYYLAVRSDALHSRWLTHLRRLLATEAAHAAVAVLHGYQLHAGDNLLRLEQCLPWYSDGEHTQEAASEDADVTGGKVAHSASE